MVKNRPANAGDLGSIPGSGRSPRVEEMAPHSSILAWEIPWTEEPGGLQSMGSQSRTYVHTQAMAYSRSWSLKVLFVVHYIQSSFCWLIAGRSGS